LGIATSAAAIIALALWPIIGLAYFWWWFPYVSGLKLEWKDMLRDLEKLQEVEVDLGAQRFFLRTELRGNCVDILRAVGMRVPPAVRQ